MTINFVSRKQWRFHIRFTVTNTSINYCMFKNTCHIYFLIYLL